MELNEQIRAQKNIELRKRVYRAIQSMYGLFRSSPRDTQIVDRYMNVWKPPTLRKSDPEGKKDIIIDVVEFPYESKKGSMAEKKNATHCLFALVTTLIQVWHKHCKDEEDPCTEALEAWLDKIELAIKLRLELPVRGSDITGYYLKMPKGE